MGKIWVFIRSRLYIMAIQLIMIYLIIGCGSSKNDTAKAQQIKFEVIDSLLGTNYEIPKSGMSIRPPANFVALPDSILRIFQVRFKEAVGDSEGMELQQFFVDEPNNSGLLISTVKGLNLSSDTSRFVSRYRAATFQAFGQPNVKTNEYWVGNIYIKDFMVTDSLNIKYQLLCMSKANDGLELQFFTSKQLYPRLAGAIKSSIGSLKVLH